jgi:hypothetical protein
VTTAPRTAPGFSTGWAKPTAKDMAVNRTANLSLVIKLRCFMQPESATALPFFLVKRFSEIGDSRGLISGFCR